MAPHNPSRHRTGNFSRQCKVVRGTEARRERSASKQRYYVAHGRSSGWREGWDSGAEVPPAAERRPAEGRQDGPPAAASPSGEWHPPLPSARLAIGPPRDEEEW